MKKRIITAVIAALLILSFVLGMTACGNTTASDAAAVEEQTVEGTQIKWSYDSEDKTLTIKGSGDILKIDSEFNPEENSEEASQKKNEKIAAIPWYSVRHSVEKIRIEEENGAITSIGDYAFYYMPKLKEITIPANVQKLGVGVFAFCSSLEAINLPETLQSVGYGCFEACTSLKNIFVPAGVTNIGSRAFAHCAKLEQAYVMSTALAELKDGTFMGCSKLTKLVMNVASENEDGTLKVPISGDPFKGGCAIDTTKIEYIEATTEEVTLTITYDVPAEAPTQPKDNPVVVSGRIGTSYRVESPAIEGYTADKAVVEGMFTDNDEVVVTYKSIEAETEAATEAPAETEPVEEGEGRPTGSKVGYIIAIVIFVLVIAGIVVFAVIMIKSDKKNDKNGKKTNKKSDKKNGKK